MEPEILNDKQQQAARTGGKVLRDCLNHVAALVTPGITTLALDKAAEEFIRSHEGAKPAFKGYHGYTGTLCTSVNEQCVHGVPGDYTLQEGDIIALDCGVLYDGINTDACITVPVGQISAEAQSLLTVTKQALDAIIPLVKAGTLTGDISATIQKVAEDGGFKPVRSLTGHGLGTTLHQPPDVPNLGKAGTGVPLVAGSLVAIEPIFSSGADTVEEAEDGWTLNVTDGGLSAHYEHSFIIGENSSEIVA